jgi:predicted HicB family RNase H-like nuclease
LAQQTLVYKGYHGSITVNNEDYSLNGRVLFIDEDLPYSGATFTELEENFRQAVESHRSQCLARGETPPFTD